MALLIRSAEEVYRYFHAKYGDDGDGDPNAVGLFAYALVEKDKFDWITHERAHNNGVAPNEAAITRWYEQKPQGYFDEKSNRALAWYRAFARLLLADDIEAEKEEAIRSSVVDAVERMKSEAIAEVAKLSGLKAFAVNVVSGVVAGIVVSALALFFYAYHEAHSPDLVDQLNGMVGQHPIPTTQPPRQ